MRGDASVMHEQSIFVAETAIFCHVAAPLSRKGAMNKDRDLHLAVTLTLSYCLQATAFAPMRSAGLRNPSRTVQVAHMNYWQFLLQAQLLSYL